jgi:Uma2 family endonuclease
MDTAVSSLMEQVLQSPRLPQIVLQFQHVLDDERARREAFHEALTEDEKAEFINGAVIVQSPVKYEHTRVGGLLYWLLSAFVRIHGAGYVGYEKVLVSLTRNDYEPDLCYFGKAKADQFVVGQVRFPAPDLVVEILSESTEAIDRGVKFEDYAAHGVSEYWLVDPRAEVIEQYRLEGDSFTLLLKMNDGLLRSVAIAGLEFPVRAIFDDAENTAAVRQIMG